MCPDGLATADAVRQFNAGYRDHRFAELLEPQAQHWSTSAFDAAMVLLKSIVAEAIRPITHLPAELGPDRTWCGLARGRTVPSSVR